MKYISAIGGGIAGAIALTVIHETARRLRPDAPRMDLLGMEAIAKMLQGAKADVPKRKELFRITMVGDIVGNSLYYSLAGVGDSGAAPAKGALLGLAAGLGAVYFPKPLGLRTSPSSQTTQTKIMTVALYLLGGCVAGVTGEFLEKNLQK